MANEKSTNIPLLIFVICFIGGMVLGAWGWDKNESTIPARTHGAVTMIIAGCTMIAGGLLGMYLIGGGTKK